MENVLVSLTAGPRNRSRCYVHSTNALKQKHPGILELLLCVRLSFDHNFFCFFFFLFFSNILNWSRNLTADLLQRILTLYKNPYSTFMSV